MAGLRADTGPGISPFVVDNVMGGIDTVTPPHKMGPSFSPDLLNVLPDGAAMRKRGGFVPVCRELPKASALSNRGVLMKGRVSDASAVNTDYRTVAGACYAGHRACWEDAEIRNGITVDLFCTVSDLTTSVGGNANPTGAAPFGPAPFTVKVRPILAKGPTKRWADPAQLGAFGTGAIWQANVPAIPLFLYLFNNAGTWEFRFSFHYFEGGNWQIRTLSTPITALGGVRLDTLYQVTCGYDIAGNSCFLRIRGRFDTGSPTAVTVSGTVGAGAQTAMTTMTKTPVQVFDCPQAIIETAAAAHPTTPPGLGLGGAADGGYWFGTMRFEGSIEDIAIYRGLVANAATGALDRQTRIEIGNPPAELLQHWPISGTQDDVISEQSGVGNPLYRTPAGPIWDAEAGGMSGGALVFNGATSYALMETGGSGTYNWRLKPDGTTKGQMWDVLAHSYGLEATFWPESIEPNCEQVVAELHGIIRLAVNYDGLIRVYVRDAPVFGNHVQYQLGTSSTHAVVPGQRYHVIVMVNPAGPTVDLVINGVRDSFPTLGAAPNTARMPSGLTVGMGAFKFTAISTTGAVEAITAGSDSINTDARTAFFGRVESVRILMGEYPFETPVPTYGGEVPTQHKGFDIQDADVRIGKRAAYPNDPAGARTQIVPTVTSEDPLPNITTGHAVSASQNVSSAGLPTLHNIGTAGAAAYTVTAIPGRASQSIYKIYAALRVRKVLGSWDFDGPIDKDPSSGGYSHSVESTWISAAAIELNPKKLVWVYRWYVGDDMGQIGSVQLRCVESDIMREYESSGTWDYRYQRRFGPYLTQGPSQLAPQWAAGLITPNLGEAPITMLASWAEEQTGERFLMARAARSLYWVKPVWRDGSPFRDELDAKSLWFSGQRNDWCRTVGVTSHGSGQTWAAHSAFIDLWIRPQRLDGKRMLMAYGDNIGTTMRYLLYLDQGCLYVAGNHVGGALWRYFHGALNGSSQEIRQTSVALDRWTHIQVAIGSSTVAVRLNGQIVTMTRSNASPLIAAANIPAATTLWVGGFDADQMAVHDSTFRFLMQPFFGQITDVRERSDEDVTWWDASESGVAPQARAVSGGTTRFLYSADSDTGWAVADASGNLADLEVGIRELVPVRHDLAHDGSAPASAAVYRNELVFTQANGNPQRVRFLGFSSPSGPFSCYRLGISAPGHQQASYYGFGTALVTQDDTSASTFTVADQTYQVYVSYMNALGEEGEAEQIGAGTASVTAYAVLHVWDVPRSADPQVVARNIYLSINGATPLYVGTITDNETDFFEIQSRGLLIAAPTDGHFLPAPMSRGVTVGVGSLVLTTQRENVNTFATSGDAPGQFPLVRRIVVDSPDGEPVISAASYLGNTFIFKRDGTWAFVAAQDALFSAGLRAINTSASVGGGVQVYDNVMYGASRRGVWLFDGNNFQYASGQLEGEYHDFDVSKDGLLAMQGVFFERESQYWLSVRARTDQFSYRVWVLTPGAGWSKLTLPNHVVMARADNPVTLLPSLLLGTLNGGIWRHDPDVSVDGLPTTDHHAGAQVVSGTPSGSTSTTLTIGAGAFDTAYSGLRGLTVQFVDADGLLLAERTIVSNTATVLTWDEDYTIPAGATFHIGGYSGYWTSPWIAPQPYGSFLLNQEIDLDFEPNSGSLVVENAVAMTTPTDRTFDGSAAERRSVSMSRGYLDQPIPTPSVRAGRYIRLAVRTNGSNTPFSLTGYGLRLAPSGTRGRPT